MTDASRTVRRLRLRAPDAAQARHAQVLLDDALRCASLTDDAADGAGRLVLVRRLALGRLPLRASPQSVALLLERRFAQTAAAQVGQPGCHGAGAGAGASEVVWFRDALEAQVALALRLTGTGTPPSEWFWSLAVPGYEPSGGAAAGLRRVLGSLASRPEAPAGLPAWIGALADAGRLAVLSAALTDADVPALRAAARLVGRRAEGGGGARPSAGVGGGRDRGGWPAGREVSDGTAAASGAAALLAAASPAVREFLFDALERSGRALPRVVARSAARSAGASGSPAAVASIPPAAASAAGFDAPAAEVASSAVAGPAATASDAAADARSMDAADAAGPVRSAMPPPPPPAVGSLAPADLRPSTPSAHREARPPTAGIDAFDATLRPTRAGGLLLLVRILDQLGYAAWADEHRADDPGAVARLLFGLLLGRLGVPCDDPAWRVAAGPAVPSSALPAGSLPLSPDALACPAAAGGAPVRGVAASASSIDAAAAVTPVAADSAGADAETRVDVETGADMGTTGAEVETEAAASARRALADRLARLGAPRSLPAPPPGAPADAACAAGWLVIVRRWLRRVAGIGPATLVLRPAWLALTPTHADVCAGLQAIDLRVRRAGLDIDPGWVPWLGRVVSFRYDARYHHGLPAPGAATGRAVAASAPTPAPDSGPDPESDP